MSMILSKVGYIPGGYLNGAASASAAGATDAESGLPLYQGIVLGQIYPQSDDSAKRYSKPGGATLYGGFYQWAQLDPLYSGSAIPVGTPLYFVESSNGGPVVVTPTQVVSGAGANALDFAGTSIDPNFGPSLPFAYVQVGPGTHTVLAGGGTSIVPGTSVVAITNTATDNYYAAVAYASALPHTFVGVPLATIASGATGLARITRNYVR